jgi:RNA recognition motif-containing protein
MVAVWKPNFMKKGKGQGKSSPLDQIDTSCKVWIGNLPLDADWKAVEAHFNQVSKTRWVEVMPRGVACAAYRTSAEAITAIASLNGTEFGGQVIQVDTWNQKSPGKKIVGRPGGKAGWSGKGKEMSGWSWVPDEILFQTFGKGSIFGKGGKGIGRANPLKEIDASCKVWIGDLAPEVDWKQLQAHCNTVGKTRWVEVMRKGIACAAYRSAEEATVAIAGLNGTILCGQAIQADVWSKKS